MTTLNDLRAKMTPREKSVTLVADGALLAEHEALAEQLATAMAQTRTSLADGSDVHDLAARLTALEEQLATSTVTIRLRGIGRNAFRRLLAEHEADGQPFNKDTFPVALVAACAIDPVMTEADALSLGDILTDGQWDDVFSAAWDACREVDGVPFSALASAVTRGSGE
jgi:hypothetical protein